jgi:4-hydroxy-2-oxoheptanedioate aldolase
MTTPAELGLRGIVAAKGHVLNSYLQMPGAFAAEVYAAQGWDAIMLDYQHGLIGYADAVAILQAIRSSGVLPLARVPGIVPSEIMKLLDAGVMGIVCAMVNTPEDAAALVRCCRYPPVGERSLGPVRAAVTHGAGYPGRANDTVGILAMIETAQAIANVEAIVATDGIDGVYVGPADLAMSLGRPVSIGKLDPQVHEAIETIHAACRRHGKIIGMIAPDAETAWSLVQRGFQFVTLSSDMRALTEKAKGWVDGFKALAGR